MIQTNLVAESEVEIARKQVVGVALGFRIVLAIDVPELVERPVSLALRQVAPLLGALDLDDVDVELVVPGEPVGFVHDAEIDVFGLAAVLLARHLDAVHHAQELLVGRREQFLLEPQLNPGHRDSKLNLRELTFHNFFCFCFDFLGESDR